jgi:hypothetical protein
VCQDLAFRAKARYLVIQQQDGSVMMVCSYLANLRNRNIILFALLIGGCVRSTEGIKNADITRDEAKTVLLAVQEGYASYGKQDVFVRLRKDNRVTVTKCEKRYLVEFSPRGFTGFDGGSQVTVDRRTLEMNDSYYLPTGCGQSYSLD